MDTHRELNAVGAPLVVADWTVDPAIVAAACAARCGGATALHVLVPAWLHGLDWVGDPFASVPCAHRQLHRLSDLCLAAGLRVESSAVGDPDPVNAICDAVNAHDIAQVLLFAPGRHASSIYPLSVARRAQRLTGLPVQSFSVPPLPRARGAHRFGEGRCDNRQAAQAA